MSPPKPLSAVDAVKRLVIRKIELYAQMDLAILSPPKPLSAVDAVKRLVIRKIELYAQMDLAILSPPPAALEAIRVSTVM